MIPRLPRTLQGKKLSEALHKRCVATWSGELSFASPESDFKATGTRSDAPPASSSPTHVWSRSLSYASPEVDFTDTSNQGAGGEIRTEWSGSLSFSSPESDFTAFEPDQVHGWEWSQQLSFTSPESDFSSSIERNPWAIFEGVSTTEDANLAAHLSSPESAYGSVHAHSFLEDHHLEELARSLPPLPQTFSEVMDNPLDERAIVVTETTAPFRVVHVNDAWVGLCGFTPDEARYQTLSLIQGPETDVASLDNLVVDLLEGKESSTVVTNYSKNGRKFLNRLRARPLVDQDNQVTHFVGVLEELIVDESVMKA